MDKFEIENNVVYHKCMNATGVDRGVCEFSTSADGFTGIKCRSCGTMWTISGWLTYYDVQHRN